MKKYNTIFFDLDHTLWDFKTNARITISEMYDHFEMKRMGFAQSQDVYQEYERINESLWVRYRLNEIDKATLRHERFSKLISLVGIDDKDLAEKLNEHYMTECRIKTNLMPGARDVLENLSERYPLHIISNGFKEAQLIKLKTCDIERYFDQVILSEEVGYQKPQQGIFREAVKRAGADKQTSIYIGDHIETDVIGAINFGMDVVFYNPDGVTHNEKATHEVRALKELIRIL